MTRLQGFHECTCAIVLQTRRASKSNANLNTPPQDSARWALPGEPHKGRSADRFLKGSVRKRGVEIKTTCKRALVCKASWTIRRPRGDTRWVRAHWFVMSDASNFARR